MADKTSHRPGGAPGARGLGSAARSLAGAVGTRALSSALHRVEGSAGRLQEYADGGGPGLKAALTGASELAAGKSPGRTALGAGMSALKESAGNLVGGGKGRGRNLKVTNIVEEIDIAAPVRLVYDQWTQFGDFPSFMKKVESVDAESDETLNWKAQVFWSHRTWQATISKQVPDRMIVWTSKGQKGHVDGAVTFHEVGPELCRVLLVLEYHPQGLFEHTGNIWRAQGRRVRLELKHFKRHVMTQAVLHPDEIEGWRGVIEDGEVVKDHQTAIAEERDQRDEPDERRRGREAPSGEFEDDEYDDGEFDEDEPEYADDDETADLADDYDDDEDDEDEDEAEDAAPPRRRPARAARPRTGGRS